MDVKKVDTGIFLFHWALRSQMICHDSSFCIYCKLRGSCWLHTHGRKHSSQSLAICFREIPSQLSLGLVIISKYLINICFYMPFTPLLLLVTWYDHLGNRSCTALKPDAVAKVPRVCIDLVFLWFLMLNCFLFLRGFFCFVFRSFIRAMNSLANTG